MSSKDKELAIKIAAKMDKTFSSVINQTNNKMQSVGEVAKKAASVVTGAFAAIKIKDFIGESISVCADFQQQMANLQAQTGASASELKELEQSSKNLFKGNYGEDITDVANALATVKQQTDLTGEALEETSKSALILKDTFGFEVSESVRSVDMMMKQFGITSTEAYNLLAQGAQNGLNKNDNLLDSVNEYSVHFKKIGLDAQGMLNIFDNVSKTGVFDLDKIGDAVKEFTIRSIDGSKSTISAYKELGLSADSMAKKFANGGEDASKAFSTVIDAISKVKDPVEQDAIGVSLFGTMWEDMGKQAILALDSTQGALDQTQNTLEEINKQKYSTLQGSINGLKRQFDVLRINSIEKITPTLTTGINYITNALPIVSGKIEGIINKIHISEDTFNSLKNVGVNAFNNIKATISENQYVFDNLKQVTLDLKQKLFDAFEYCKPTLIYLIEEGLPYVTNNLLQVLDGATDVYNFVNDNWSSIAPIAAGIGGAIAGIKMVGFAKGVATATKAITLLSAAKVKDKYETIALQILYAKDAIAKGASTFATYAQTAAVKAYTTACKIGAIATKGLSGAFSFLTSPVGLVILAITALIAAGVWLYKHWDEVKVHALNIWNSICDIFNSVKSSVGNIMNNLAEKFPTTFAIINGYFGLWKQEIEVVINAIKGIFNGIVQFVTGVFSGNWSQAWEGVVNIFGSIFGAIVDIARIPINGAIDLINSLTSKLSSIKINVPDWVPGIGGKTFGMDVPEIPHLATGGIATKSTIAEIGEGSEPEAVLPLSKLSSMLEQRATESTVNVQSQPQQQPQLVYSPSYNFYGGTPSKEDIAGAEQMTQAKFNKMMAEWQRQNKRVSFGGV